MASGFFGDFLHPLFRRAHTKVYGRDVVFRSSLPGRDEEVSSRAEAGGRAPTARHDTTRHESRLRGSAQTRGSRSRRPQGLNIPSFTGLHTCVLERSYVLRLLTIWWGELLVGSLIFFRVRALDVLWIESSLQMHLSLGVKLSFDSRTYEMGNA